jgi:methyl-accepting chemotaxis protein
VTEVNQATEKGVISAGRALSAIVETARGHVTTTADALKRAQASDSGVSGAVTALSSMVREYLREASGSIETQAKRSKQMAGMLDEVGASARLIADLAVATRILALNAQIEATRQGDAGRGFAVIAAEMSRLSTGIAQANQMVHSLVGRLAQTVPELGASAQSMLERAQGFSTRLEEQLRAVDSGAASLREALSTNLTAGEKVTSAILSQSMDALSALQFQDPAAQKLQTMDALFEENGEAEPEHSTPRDQVILF